MINKICRDIGKVADLVNSISKEFQLSVRIQPDSAVPTQDGGRRQGSSGHLEEQLREANSFLKQIGDWLVVLAKTHQHVLKSLEMAQNEVESAHQQIKVLEQRTANA